MTDFVTAAEVTGQPLSLPNHPAEHELIGVAINALEAGADDAVTLVPATAIRNTIVAPGTQDSIATAWKVTGEANPRIVVTPAAIYFGDGIIHPYNDGSAFIGPNATNDGMRFDILEVQLVEANEIHLGTQLYPADSATNEPNLSFSGLIGSRNLKLAAEGSEGFVELVDQAITDDIHCRNRLTIEPPGGIIEIPDAYLIDSSVGFWLDDTPGATALMIKAKDSAGTVRTATIPLT